MHGEGRAVSDLWFANRLEQRRAQTLHELRGDDVGRLGGAADPLPQMVEIEFFSGLCGHDEPVRTRGADDVFCSPIAGTAP